MRLGISSYAYTWAIGICLDSVNSMGTGEGVHAVTELLGPHTINLHVKEFIVRRIAISHHR